MEILKKFATHCWKLSAIRWWCAVAALASIFAFSGGVLANYGFPEKPTGSITSIDSASGVISAREASSGQVFQFKLTNPLLLKSLTVGQSLYVDLANKLVSLDGSRINGNIVNLGPIDGAKPLGPIDGAKPAGPVDGIKSGQLPGAVPRDTVGPYTGSRPIGPVDAAKPLGPIDGAKPLGPIDGVKPAAPTDGFNAAPGAPCCEIIALDASRGLVTARNNQTGQSFQFQLSNAALFRSLKLGQAVSANLSNHQASVTVNGQAVTGSIVGAAR